MNTLQGPFCPWPRPSGAFSIWPRPADAAEEAGVYAFTLRGKLPERWSEWFDFMWIDNDAGGFSRLTGYVRDQSALHGIIARVRDLGLVLLSAERLDAAIAAARPEAAAALRGESAHAARADSCRDD